mmetsp:Transcript_100686/g.184033  ORF Transcript_100686/g.184033 Transcript_100686/m.184033 type:complete len:210 (+) Transcript_100686:575-1204(+)
MCDPTSSQNFRRCSCPSSSIYQSPSNCLPSHLSIPKLSTPSVEKPPAAEPGEEHGPPCCQTAFPAEACFWPLVHLCSSTCGLLCPSLKDVCSLWELFHSSALAPSFSSCGTPVLPLVLHLRLLGALELPVPWLCPARGERRVLLVASAALRPHLRHRCWSEAAQLLGGNLRWAVERPSSWPWVVYTRELVQKRRWLQVVVPSQGQRHQT